MRKTRRTGLARSVAVALIWISATVVGLFVTTSTKVGPVVLAIDPDRGVHLGDVLAFVGSYCLAHLLTVLVRPPAE